MAKTYGILSDMHDVDIREVPFALSVLGHEGIDSIILNGDISGERSGYDPQEYLATVLDVSAKYEMDVFVLPGSHEQVKIFEPCLNHFSKKYSNIVNTFNNQKIEFPDHHLLFLQGSDFMPGKDHLDGYVLNSERESGFYKNDDGIHHKVINPNDMKKLVTHPEKTLVFSHVPRRFDSLDSVDVAEFGEFQDSYHEFHVQFSDDSKDILFLPITYTKNEIEKVFKDSRVRKVLYQNQVPQGTIYAPIEAAIAHKKKFPFLRFSVKKGNRGNEELTKLYAELGITKNVTGHFHESAGKANDLEGKVVEESQFVENLFYNAACMDRSMVGMVSVDGNKVAYENIDLRKYRQQ
ncbi:MAG TPA: hypothetical protein VEC16_00785 [Alphaproteobacteria bacterium]|nr:hypothetical protein [Alphaproteobacteria bacterium]